MEWLSSGVLTALTPWSVILVLVLGFVTSFMSGKIRPGVAITEIREDRDARLAEAHVQIADWKEAYRLSEAARETNAASLREALEVARAAEEALKGFRAATLQVAREQGSNPA